MSAEKKTITINPELFKVQSSKTRKQRDKTTGGDDIPKLRVRGEPKKSRRDMTMKNQVLKYIRQEQEKRLRASLEKENEKQKHGGAIPSPANKSGLLETQEKFDSDFSQSLEFLQHLAEKTQNKIAQGVSTLKNRASAGGQNTQSSVLYNGGVLNNILEHNIDVVSPQNGANNVVAFKQSPFNNAPQYGCLKGGTLPTYRNWKQTMKYHPPSPHPVTPAPTHAHSQPQMPVHPPIHGGSFPDNTPHPSTQNGGEVEAANPDNQGEIEAAQRIQNLRNKFQSPEWMKNKREMRSFQNKKDEVVSRRGAGKPKIKRMKQKKTVRRTYRVGKSKYYPRVSVLVSNRTIRKQITEKNQKLKQVPIEEVRKTLIKKGFIKVGSIAPNDVLRKMYETISMLCGDVHNHNSENMVYNYFNGYHEN